MLVSGIKNNIAYTGKAKNNSKASKPETGAQQAPKSKNNDGVIRRAALALAASFLLTPSTTTVARAAAPDYAEPAAIVYNMDEEQKVEDTPYIFSGNKVEEEVQDAQVQRQQVPVKEYSEGDKPAALQLNKMPLTPVAPAVPEEIFMTSLPQFYAAAAPAEAYAAEEPSAQLFEAKNTTHIEENGVSYDWEYDDDGVITKHTITRQDGQTEVYTFDEGVLAHAEITAADETVYTFDYDETGKTVTDSSITKKDGTVQQNYHNAEGKIYKSVINFADKSTGVYTFNEESETQEMLTSELTSADGTVQKCTYKDGSIVIASSIEGADGTVQVNTHDQETGVITKSTITYESGVVAVYNFEDGKMASSEVTIPDVSVQKCFFDEDQDMTSTVIEKADGTKQEINFYKNQKMKDQTITYPDDSVEKYTYNEDELITNRSKENADGTLEIDWYIGAPGQLSFRSIAYPEGDIKNAFYFSDANGNLTSMWVNNRDGSSEKWSYENNKPTFMEKWGSPDGSRGKSTFDENGDLKTVNITGRDGSSTVYNYVGGKMTTSDKTYKEDGRQIKEHSEYFESGNLKKLTVSRPGEKDEIWVFDESGVGTRIQ